MKTPIPQFMTLLGTPPRNPNIERAVPRVDPDTREPTDPQGQGQKLGTVPVRPEIRQTPRFISANEFQATLDRLRAGK